MAIQRRRSGFRDFLDGFTGTYNAFNQVAQDIQTANVMKEKPEEITSDQLSDQEYADQQLATQGPVAPKQTRYDGKTYSGTLDDRKLTGLRMGRLADIAAKYGDAKGAMSLRKQVSDMEYEDKARARTEVGWQREDDDYRRRQQARDVMAEIDPANPDSYVAASGKLTALGDAQGAADVMRQGGQQKEWMKARENEGIDAADLAIREGQSPEAVMEKFNATGKFKMDGPPIITRKKDSTGREVISISGTMNGQPFNVGDWDQWLTGRMSVDKRQEAAARTRSEGREVDKIVEDKRRFDLNYKLDDRRTRAAEESARASREATRIAREQQIADKEAARRAQAEDRYGKAATALDGYVQTNPVVYDNVDGKEVVNPKRAAELREFLNAHEQGVEVPDGKGGKRILKVDLVALHQSNPRAAKAMVDRLTDQFLLHKAAEESTGQKLPYYSDISYGSQNAADYTRRKGLGPGQTIWNVLTDGDVIRYGNNVALDYSSLADGPYGERIKRALDGRQTLFSELSRKPNQTEQQALGYMGGGKDRRGLIGGLDMSSQLGDIARIRRANELKARYANDPKSLSAAELTELLKLSQGGR